MHSIIHFVNVNINNIHFRLVGLQAGSMQRWPINWETNFTRTIFQSDIHPGNIHQTAKYLRRTCEMKTNTYTCFDGNRRMATGSLDSIALVFKRAIEGGAVGSVLIFDDDTGRSYDIDIRGSDEEVVARVSKGAISESEVSDDSPTAIGEPGIAGGSSEGPRGRGRPKLGVVPREVTLLPRHWEWLATQPGGASVALRKLVEEARRVHADKDRMRHAQERAYHFMSAMAGDLPGFEEAIRALFADDESKFGSLITDWPDDIRHHATWLAYRDRSRNALSNA